MTDKRKLDYNLKVVVNESYNSARDSKLLTSYGDDSRLVAMLAPSVRDGIEKIEENLFSISQKMGENVSVPLAHMNLYDALYDENTTFLVDPTFPVALGYFVDATNKLCYVLTEGATIIHGKKVDDGVDLDVLRYAERTEGLDDIISGYIDVQEGDVLLFTTEEITSIVPNASINGLIKIFYDDPSKLVEKIKNSVAPLSSGKINRNDVPLVVVKVGEIGYQNVVSGYQDAVVEDITDQQDGPLSGVPRSDTIKEEYNPEGLSLGLGEDGDVSLDTLELDTTDEGIDDNSGGLLSDEEKNDQTTTDPHRYAVAVPDLERTDKHDAIRSPPGVSLEEAMLSSDGYGLPSPEDSGILTLDEHLGIVNGLRESQRQMSSRAQAAEELAQINYDAYESWRDAYEQIAGQFEEAKRKIRERDLQINGLEVGNRQLQDSYERGEGLIEEMKSDLSASYRERDRLQEQITDLSQERKVPEDFAAVQVPNIDDQVSGVKMDLLPKTTSKSKQKTRWAPLIKLSCVAVGLALTASVVINGTYKPLQHQAEGLVYELETAHVINTHPQKTSCDNANAQFELLEQDLSQEVRATEAFERAQDLETRFLTSHFCE